MRKILNSLILLAIVLVVALMLSYITLTMYNISNKAFSTAYLGGAVSVLIVIRCYSILERYRIK